MAAHTLQREGLFRRHIDGRPCWWCSKPMYREPARNWDGRVLHADHSTPRSKGGRVADRLTHGSCNEQRGDGSRDHTRPALGATATDTATRPDRGDLGPNPLSMGWPDSFLT